MSMSEQPSSLRNTLLVAMPTLTDPTFHHSVVYLYEYNSNGAMGTIINKPLPVNLGEVLKHLEIPVTDEHVYEYKVLKGGPISQTQGFIIQRFVSPPEADADYDIVISGSKQNLIEVGKGNGLNDTIVTLGYAGWKAGQLEKEIAENSWIIAPVDVSIIFEVPFEQRWRKAAALAGIDVDRLSSDVGHA